MVLRQDADPQPLCAARSGNLFALGEEAPAQSLAATVCGYGYIAHVGIVIRHFVLILAGHLNEKGRIANKSAVIFCYKNVAAIGFDLGVEIRNVRRADLELRLHEGVDGALMALQFADESEQGGFIARVERPDRCDGVLAP